MLKRLMQAPSIDWETKYEKKQALASHACLQEFYATPIPTADTPLEEIEFLAMDFETTGLDPKKDDIITIGVVPFTLNRIFINRAQHWTVRPRQQLAEDSVVIHGITHSDILDAPDLSDVFEHILKAMSGHITVVHYKRIEREFFDRALKTRIQEGIEFPVIDTMHLESKIQQKEAGGLWNKLKGKKSESVRLGKTRTRYGLPAYTPHHALTDAIATAELLQAQIAHHFDAKLPIRDFWQ
ncbi:3'-5' exonuclease [Vibrio sp. Of7-15]|uniref:3'-5' exonuclease n=1 Tax=Vibrio sp. Of7-15 TaxID=2724879 RepID=UPI001EF219A7|nr:3'-5' exonuclease [Vibrio sp. Of7-15]MCG7499637.1 3'-5' exonuclease [Vibrio sp. Of7-15]